MKIEHGSALLWAAGLVLVACSWATPVGAQTTTIGANLTFAATNQNQWGNGDPLAVTSSGPQFLGVGPLSLGRTVGGIYTDPAGGQWGAQLGVTADAKVGINYNINATAGSLNLSYPVQVGFTVPTPSTAQVGKSFDITFGLLTPSILTSAIVLSGGGTIVPSLTTTGPHVGAFADAYLSAHMFAGAEACVFDCFGPHIAPGIGPVTQELLAMNMNSLTTYDQGVFRVMGVPQGSIPSSTGTSYPPPDGPLSFSAQIPTLNSDSRISGGVSGDVITANDRSNVLTLNLNVDKLVSNVLGLPPLNGTVLGMGYNLLTANAGLGVDIAQSFTFDPNLSATLNFGSGVFVNGGSTLETNVTFTLGQTVHLAAPNALTLQATPTYDLHNSTTNNTSLKLTGAANVTALGANIYGLTIPPLIQEHVAADLTGITLASRNFETAVAPLFGDPFNIQFSPIEYVNNVPFDLCAAVVGGCTNTGLVGVSHWLPDSGYYKDTIFQVSAYSQLPDGYPSWEAYLTHVPTAGGPPVGYSDPYLFDASGTKVFFDNLADILATSGASLPVSNTTDANAAYLLAGTGFVDQPTTFVIPEGDPAPVPEPGTLLLLGSELAGLGAMRRKFRK